MVLHVRQPGIAVVTSRPKRVPGRQIWKPYEGKEYLVFIDESFYKFFDFARTDGNFVHGAAGLPTSQYDSFRKTLSTAVEEYFEAFAKTGGIRPIELKSGDLYKVDFSLRRRLVGRLRVALEKHGGFVAGFYTGNRGYVMEKIREDLISEEGVIAVPEDHQGLFERKVRELNTKAIGPGVSSLISNLLFLPVAAIGYFFSDLKCTFRVVYDPRQADEDVAVKNSIEGIMGAFQNAEMLGIKSKFLGMEIDRPSHSEIGLQVADIVAGEVRRCVCQLDLAPFDTLIWPHLVFA